MADRMAQAEYESVRSVVLDAMLAHTATGYPPRCQCGLRYFLDQLTDSESAKRQILGHSASMITEALARHVGLI